jgi:hypothetical protein
VKVRTPLSHYAQDSRLIKSGRPSLSWPWRACLARRPPCHDPGHGVVARHTGYRACATPVARLSYRRRLSAWEGGAERPRCQEGRGPPLAGWARAELPTWCPLPHPCLQPAPPYPGCGRPCRRAAHWRRLPPPPPPPPVGGQSSGKPRASRAARASGAWRACGGPVAGLWRAWLGGAGPGLKGSDKRCKGVVKRRDIRERCKGRCKGVV